MSDEFGFRYLPPILSRARPDPAPDPILSPGQPPEVVAMGEPPAPTPDVSMVEQIQQRSTPLGRWVDDNERVLSTALQSAQYEGVTSARRNAHVDATQARIKAIKDATGEDVPNPYTWGYLGEVINKVQQIDQGPVLNTMVRSLGPALHFVPWAMSWAGTDDWELDAFQSRLDALALKYPDKADVIGASRPITEDAKALANSAEKAAAQARSATTGLAPIVAGFLGGAIGSLRDPLMAGSLFVSAPIGAARTILGRVALEAGRQALENAAITAVSEPWIQSWRAERGKESGLGPALADVAVSAAFGTVFGAGLKTAHIGVEHLGQRLIERAERGDMQAARDMADLVPRDESPELWAAANALHDDAAVRAVARTAGVPDHAIEDAVNAAVRHAENPAEPLPQQQPLTRQEYDAAIDVRARAIDPEAFARRDALENEIIAARAQLGYILERRGQQTPIGVDALIRLETDLEKATADRIEAQRRAVEDLEQKVSEITGKRRSSQRAKDLRARLEQARETLRESAEGAEEGKIRSEIDRITRESNELREWAGARDRTAEQSARLRLNDTILRRGEIGPAIYVAREKAHAEAKAIGIDFVPDAPVLRGGQIEITNPAEFGRPENFEPPEVRAQEVIAGARTFGEAADALREEPDAIADALASGNQQLRDLGRIASLADEAYAMVRNGEASPEIAAEVAARVTNPGEQAAILKEVAEQKPANQYGAAILASQEMERRALPEANHIMLGAEGPVERTVQAPETDFAEAAGRAAQVEQFEKDFFGPPEGDNQGRIEVEAEVEAESRALTRPILVPPKPKGPAPRSLIMFLRDLGGVKDESGDLKAAGFDRHPALIRKSGLPMDKAREAAAEAGYLGPDVDRAMAETTVTDFIDAVTQHPRYSVHDEAIVSERATIEEMRAEAQRELEYRDKIKNEMVALGSPEDDLIPEALNAAARLVIRDGLEPDVAYERAIMHHLSADTRVRQASNEIAWDEWADVEPRAQASAGERTPAPEQGSVSPGEKTAGIRESGEVPSIIGQSERTEAGEQRLIPGVQPITNRERAQALADKPLKGGNAPPPEGGLFDEAARQQIDFLNTFPAATRADGKDMVPMSKEELLAREPREGFLSGLVAGCKDI